MDYITSAYWGALLCIPIVILVGIFMLKGVIRYISGNEFCSRIDKFISAEWLFKHKANGGDIVLLRTIFIGSFICLIAYFFYFIINYYIGNHSLWLDYSRDLLGRNLKTVGVIYGSVYAALYARFVSQWGHLIELYKAIQEAEISVHTSCKKLKDDEVIGKMKTDFIDFAKNVHLDQKDIFKRKIDEWKENP